MKYSGWFINNIQYQKNKDRKEKQTRILILNLLMFRKTEKRIMLLFLTFNREKIIIDRNIQGNKFLEFNI